MPENTIGVSTNGHLAINRRSNPMTLGLLIKLLLVFLFVPLVYGATWAARRWLPPDALIRAYLERNGADKVARYVLFAVYAIGGVLLTVIYS